MFRPGSGSESFKRAILVPLYFRPRESNQPEECVALAEQDRDLVLSPTQFANVQDTSSGKVRVWVGPNATTLTQNDRLVTWTGRKFVETPDINQARITFTTATENQYVVLTNPVAHDPNTFPEVGSATYVADLDIGKRIVIPGPVSFPLWPGQSAEVIDGHRLSLDEYLLVQVYEPDAAARFAEQAVEAPQTGGDPGEPKKEERKSRKQYTVGERRVIKGTETSFYIPPTGIEVLRELGPDGKPGSYTRKAPNVEQLEYIVLVAPDGRKRYERGPQVVFPEPEETFVTEKGDRKFRAIDLNAQSGIYIKVTADYDHDGDELVKAWRGSRMVEVKPGDTLKEGDELFLTGADTPIYFQRTEHSVILYGDRRKHHAIAIPAGEGRYVLDRTKGDVRKVEGPAMFLPDPRTEVVVRRVLEPKMVGLWYPGNYEAVQINQQLAGEQASRGEEYLSVEPQLLAASAAAGQAGSLSRSYAASGGLAGDRFKRGTEYSPPRTITLDTKYLGPPRISVYPGYAVMVMDPTGNRRVAEGPVDLRLEYHESLMALTLSTGRPKGTGTPIQTVYLRTVNNAVGDRVTVETRDLVPVSLELSLRVNFEGTTQEEMQRWFSVEDYIALLTDHVRSKLRNLAKRYEIQRFYTESIDLIRDALLGESKTGKEGKETVTARTGLLFPENGMRLYDVEILNVTIAEPSVKQLLDSAMSESLRGAIEVSQAEQATERESRLEGFERSRIEEREKTAEAKSAAAIHEIERDLARSLRAIAGSLQEAQAESEVLAAKRIESKADADQRIEVLRATNTAAMERVKAEVDQFVRRVEAVDPKLVDAIRIFGDERTVREITEALAPVAIAAGVPALDILRTHLKGTAVAPVLDALAERPFAELAAGNGTSEEG